MSLGTLVSSVYGSRLRANTRCIPAVSFHRTQSHFGDFPYRKLAPVTSFTPAQPAATAARFLCNLNAMFGEVFADENFTTLLQAESITTIPSSFDNNPKNTLPCDTREKAERFRLALNRAAIQVRLLKGETYVCKSLHIEE